MGVRYTELLQVRVCTELKNSIQKEAQRLSLKPTDIMRMALTFAFREDLFDSKPIKGDGEQN